MRARRSLSVALVVILLIPMTGCNLIGQNPLSAIGSLVPQVTAQDTVEATVDSGEATAESTPLVRPKTAEATAKPTATAKPKATVKATATKKDTAVPSSDGSTYLPTGTLLFSDDFSNPSSGWGEYSSDQTEQGYQDNAYVITVHDANYIAWSNANQTFADGVVEIEAAMASGLADAEYGIIFRYVDSENFYIYEINAAGSYGVYALVNNEWVELIPWTENSAINSGVAANKLAVVAQGVNFSFYINGVRVGEIADSTFGEGDIALAAATQTEGALSVSFTRINIWEVDNNVSPTPGSSAGIIKGAKLYSEGFDNPISGWDTWDGTSSQGGYIDGSYFIAVLEADQLSWANGHQNLSDFIIEVDVTKESGPDDGGYGIIFRYMDSDNFYYFAVTGDGEYSLSYYLYNARDYIVYWTASDAIKKGNATNLLSVACKGTHIILSINGTVVEDLSDDTFSFGDIGLMATTNSEGGVKVLFDNLNIWEAK